MMVWRFCVCCSLCVCGFESSVHVRERGRAYEKERIMCGRRGGSEEVVTMQSARADAPAACLLTYKLGRACARPAALPSSGHARALAHTRHAQPFAVSQPLSTPAFAVLSQPLSGSTPTLSAPTLSAQPLSAPALSAHPLSAAVAAAASLAAPRAAAAAAAAVYHRLPWRGHAAGCRSPCECRRRAAARGRHLHS